MARTPSSRIWARFPSVLSLCVCGVSAPLVDAVLDFEVQRCREASIGFSCTVEGAIAQGGFDEGELGVLFQNLLDNAIEANEHVDDQEKRLLRLAVESADTGSGTCTLRIAVTNRTDAPERPTFRMRKANPEQHGIGTRVVDDIVKAHGGSKRVDFAAAERLLTITVEL